jgi:arginase
MPNSRQFAIIEAPSGLGLVSGGVELLPGALLEAGFVERISARGAGRLEPPPSETVRDPETGILNPHAIAAYSVALADAVGEVIRRGEFPIVLGGDCSILLGNMLALRRMGRYGLLFLDGHADFYQPEAEPKGEVASMELALATGRGPAVLSNIEGRSPLVGEEDVVVLGRRDAEDAAKHGSQRIEETDVRVMDLGEVRSIGAPGAAAIALRRLTEAVLAGFWIHLDADVLDDAVMPAVDYRMAGGLSWDELVTVLRLASASEGCVGIDVTIFNPRLDEGGSIVREFVGAIASGLRSTRE